VNALLFSRISIFDVLAHRQESLKSEVHDLPSTTFERYSLQELARDLTLKFKIEIPVLEEDKAYISHREVDMDVSRDPMRMIWDRSGPFYVKATEIKFSIPFKGDPSWFDVRPSSFNLNPPRGEIRGQELHLVYTRTDDDAAAVKSEYERSLQSIKQYLSWQEGSITDFNSKVGQQVETLISQRKQKLDSAANMVASIGLPIKQNNKTPKVDEVKASNLNRNIKSPKKWDVFISHASEDKAQLARPLASALNDRGISVWYDELSLKMGDSLRSSIDFGLANSRTKWPRWEGSSGEESYIACVAQRYRRGSSRFFTNLGGSTSSEFQGGIGEDCRANHSSARPRLVVSFTKALVA
jgi:hypothetical protein